MRLLDRLYVPCLECSIRHPILTLIPVLLLAVWSASLAAKLGTSFLPPLHEPTLNVLLSLSPSASLAEAERTARHAGRVLSAIPGVGKVVRRTGRAERDQHAEPVSSSEFIVHLNGDASAVRQAIRERLGSIPGAVVGGLIIGICETFLTALGYSTFSDAFTFLLLIVILVLRPTGLFGEKMIDKV